MRTMGEPEAARQDHRRPLRPGFQAGDKIIRPEIVSVHTLKK